MKLFNIIFNRRDGRVVVILDDGKNLNTLDPKVGQVITGRTVDLGYGPDDSKESVEQTAAALLVECTNYNLVYAKDHTPTLAAILAKWTGERVELNREQLVKLVCGLPN